MCTASPPAHPSPQPHTPHPEQKQAETETQTIFFFTKEKKGKKKPAVWFHKQQSQYREHRCPPLQLLDTPHTQNNPCHPSSRLQFPKSEWVGARRPTAALHRHPKEPHRNATQRKPPLHIPRRPLRSFLRPWCMYVQHGGQKRRPGGACVGHGHVSILGDRCGLRWDWVT